MGGNGSPSGSDPSCAVPGRQPRGLLGESSEGMRAGGTHQDWSPGWAGSTEGRRSPELRARGCGEEGPRRAGLQGEGAEWGEGAE